MNGGDLAQRLQAVVVKKIGKPGTLHALEQLTGGANRSTIAFEAELDGRRCPMIVQLGVEMPDLVAGITPEVRPADQAHLMIAAAAAGAPAPPVRAILDPADGLGEGYITDPATIASRRRVHKWRANAVRFSLRSIASNRPNCRSSSARMRQLISRHFSG